MQEALQISTKRFLRGRGYIDLNFLFYVYPDLYYPLDYDTYFKSKDQIGRAHV